jgi:flagellar basal body rod protein FlgG
MFIPKFQQTENRNNVAILQLCFYGVKHSTGVVLTRDPVF